MELLRFARDTGRAFTRNGHDWSDRYQPIAAAARALNCRSVILDGEVAVQAPDGVTDFAALRRSIKGSPERLVLFAFDLLHLNGVDLRREPLIDRLRRLEDLIGAAHPDVPAALQRAVPAKASRKLPNAWGGSKFIVPC